MTDPYLALIPRVIVDIACSRETHQLVWSKGTFTTLDHADPDGERALAALGAASSRCVDILDAWHRHRTDLRLLVLAPRGDSDRVLSPDTDGSGLQGMSRGWIGPAPAMPRRFRSHSHFVVSSRGVGIPSSPEEEDDEGLLLGLGGGLPHRLAADVISHWSARLREGDVEDSHLPALTAAVYGRALRAIDRWLGRSGEVELTLIDDGDTPALRRTSTAVELHLSFGWLNRVWAPGFAVTAGQLVLDATVEGDQVHLLALAPDGGGPSTLTIATSSPAWR